MDFNAAKIALLVPQQLSRFIAFRSRHVSGALSFFIRHAQSERAHTHTVTHVESLAEEVQTRYCSLARFDTRHPLNQCSHFIRRLVSRSTCTSLCAVSGCTLLSKTSLFRATSSHTRATLLSFVFCYYVTLEFRLPATGVRYSLLFLSRSSFGKQLTYT